MKVLYCLLIFLVQFSDFRLSAQEEDSVDISYYFDDASISDRKNIISINVLYIIYGDLAIFYDWKFSQRLSLDIGAGILLPYYIPDLYTLLSGDPIIRDPDFGYSFAVLPKYYFIRNIPEFYFGLQYRRRNYNQNQERITFNDITANFGAVYIPGKKFIIDFGYGIGMRLIRGSAIRKTTEISFILSLKLGYLIK